VSADVDLLREAATLKQERAENTTGGRWELGTTSTVYMSGQAGFVMRVDGKPGVRASLSAMPSDAEHMISWDPAVAVVVARWLETVADIWVVPSEVPHYSARASVQECAVEVARAYLRREVVSR
jgi:hypothetical protein